VRDIEKFTFSDGTFAAVATNHAPVITSDGGGDKAIVSMPENSTVVTTVTATDVEPGTMLAYSIIGGADAAKFHIDAATGALSFNSAPNFEAPADADGNNSYLVQVHVSDGGLSDDQAITVNVLDVNDQPAPHKTSDFDGNGRSDILWQNADGTPMMWSMDGLNATDMAVAGFNPGAAWHVIGSGDFNGDGKADILWQNADGTPAIWLMDGTSLISGSNVGFNPGPAWQIHGTGDFNGDGKADIQWQNTDGTPAVWLMDGYDVVSGANAGADPGANWHVIPQHHDLV
jgi:hypothetical protein